MKSRILLTMALAAGSLAVAGAQDRWGYQPPRYENRGYGARGGQAYQIGMEDGRRDGEHDSFSRRSPRPEHNSNFKHADRGYRGFFGDKNYYREQYRAGYLDGYRMGYRGGGWRR